MRVAFVLGRVARGGTEGQAELLVGALRGRGVGVDVFVVEAPVPASFAGEPVTLLGGRPGRSAIAMITAALSLRRRLHRGGYDVVHSALARGYVTAALAVPRRQRARTVSWRRNLGIHVTGRTHAALERLAGRRAARVVVNSRAVADYWVAGGFVRPASVTVVPNALEPWRFDRVDPACGADAALKLVSVGNLRPVKGHDVLISAAGLLRSRGLDTAVTVVGEGVERAALEQASRTAGVPLQLPGSVADPRPWLEWADVVVHPSRSEGSSNALAEAMAYGCAVVASDVGGIPEMLGDSGRLVPPDDADALASALAALAADPLRRAELARAAQARARALYDLDAVVTRHLAIYAEGASCAA